MFVAIVATSGCRMCLPSDTDTLPDGAVLSEVATTPLDALCEGEPEHCEFEGPVPSLDAFVDEDDCACGGAEASAQLQRRDVAGDAPTIGLLPHDGRDGEPHVAFSLVIRTAAGWYRERTPVGYSREARQGSEYVHWLGADYGTYVSLRDGRTSRVIAAVYEHGIATPEGCDLHTAAEVRLRLCPLVNGVPWCVGDVLLENTDYREDNLLPTVDEALGECDDADYSPTSPRDDSTSRDVSLVTHDRLVITEHGERRVYALGELLCELSHSTAFCPVVAPE
jgi:hypothetical protein